MADSRLCSIPDCGNSSYVRGLCNAHYKRLLRHGDPSGGRKTFKGDLHKFLQYVRAYEGDECIFWPFSRTHGYGTITIGQKRFTVSRLMCEEMNGPPDGDRNSAAHSCNNGHLGCVTKRHLSWKTHRENMEDMLAAGSRVMGEDHAHSKLTDSDVIKIRDLLKKNWKVSDLSKTFQISRQAITDIKFGRTWKHLP